MVILIGSNMLLELMVATRSTESEATLAHVGYPNFGKSDHEKLEPDDWRSLGLTSDAC